MILKHPNVGLKIICESSTVKTGSRNVRQKRPVVNKLKPCRSCPPTIAAKCYSISSE